MDPELFHRWCQTALKRYSIPWFGRFTQVDGETVHYMAAGEGPPLVLVHGFLSWSYTWRRNLAALATRARVVAPDLRGFGLSAKESRRGHSLSDQVELLGAVMDALSIDQTVLCGHSMGGEIAMRFALRYPERVRALILVASSGYVTRIERPMERWIRKIPVLGALFVRAAVLNRRFAASSLRTGYFDPLLVAEQDVDAYLLPARAPGAAGALLSMVRDMDFGASSARWPEISHRSLLIWGENDPWIPLAHGQRLHAHLPQSELVVFPQCGHLPQEEHPDRFNRSVLAFLDTLEKEDW